MPYTTEQLSDRQDIADVLAQYCRAIDDNRPADVAEMFAEDCVLDYGGDYTNLVGRRLAQKFFAGGTDRLYKRSAHQLSNIEITLSSVNTATSIAYVNAWHEFNDTSVDNAWIYGRYMDELTKQDGRWLIAKRTFRAMGHAEWASPVTYITRG